MSEMSSKDRVLAAFKKQPVDRAPVITGSVYIVESMDRVGAKWPDLHKDPAMMLKVASVPSQVAGTDNIVLPFGMFIEAYSVGCDINWGKKEIQPSVRGHFESPDEVEYEDLLEKPLIQTTVEATRMAVDEFPDVLCFPFLVSPATLGGYLMGVENLVMKSMTDPEDAAKWVEVAKQMCKMYSGAVIEAGAKVIYYSDASASPDLVMPDFYKSVAMPAMREVVDFVHSKGALAELHICGNTIPIIESMADTGADALSIEQTVDMAEAKKLVGDRVALLGNVPPLYMVDGTPEQIVDATRQSLDKGADVVMPGCGTPPLAKLDNLKLMVQTTIDYFKEK